MIKIVFIMAFVALLCFLGVGIAAGNFHVRNSFEFNNAFVAFVPYFVIGVVAAFVVRMVRRRSEEDPFSGMLSGVIAVIAYGAYQYYKMTHYY